MALDKANIVEQLSNATVIEIADLVKELETKWGVSAAAPVAAAPPVVAVVVELLLRLLLRRTRLT